MGDSEFVTAQEVAKHFGVSDEHIRRLVHRGDLPGVKVGRSIRIRRRAVQEYELENSTV